MFEPRATTRLSNSECLFTNPGMNIIMQKQERGACVPTCLAAIAGVQPSQFYDVDSQDPRTWSSALLPYGVRLEYCPNDSRAVRHYHDELSKGLWLVGYYLDYPVPLNPDEHGWLCGSHLVVVHAGCVYDPSSDYLCSLGAHISSGRPTKRIFRVVPIDAEGDIRV